MKQNRGNKKKWIGYTLYGIFFTCFLLYYRFPSNVIRDYLKTNAHKKYPGFNLSIERIYPTFPIGLKFVQTEIANKKNPGKALFKTESISLGPRLLSLFKGDHEYIFECLANRGSIKGRIDFIEKPLGPPFSTSILVKDLPIGDIFLTPSIIGREVNGVVNGTITYKMKDRSLINGSGDADLTLSGGKIRLLNPVLNLDYLDFKEALLKMNMKDKKIILSHVELKGNNIHGSASGTIYLNKEIQKSRIDLRGLSDQYAGLLEGLKTNDNIMNLIKRRLKGGKLSFTVKGTIKDPRFRLL